MSTGIRHKQYIGSPHILRLPAQNREWLQSLCCAQSCQTNPTQHMATGTAPKISMWNMFYPKTCCSFFYQKRQRNKTFLT